jgi:hypothetical protein
MSLTWPCKLTAQIKLVKGKLMCRHKTSTCLATQ